jgi:hypothetical protein
MQPADLIRVIQQEARPLVESLYSELRTNLGTSHYHRLSNDELFRRGQAVYDHLADWLSSPDESAVARAGDELGRRRFGEGIPLGQVILALVLEENHLWDFIGCRPADADPRLAKQVSEFFAKTIYSTAHGYEQVLAESNRRSRRGVQTAAVPTVEPASPGYSRGVEVSRGGQVGEHGG